MKKETEDKFTLRQFKDKSSNWFLNNKHYHLNEQGLIVFICGGKEDEEEIKYLEEFCKRNKKKFKSREPSVFESEPREWSELTFGKFKGQRLDVVKDTEPKYLKWLILNSADKKLTEEIKELLKIK